MRGNGELFRGLDDGFVPFCAVYGIVEKRSESVLDRGVLHWFIESQFPVVYSIAQVVVDSPVGLADADVANAWEHGRKAWNFGPDY